jgi:hypothetical protein
MKHILQRKHLNGLNPLATRLDGFDRPGKNGTSVKVASSGKEYLTADTLRCPVCLIAAR